MLKLLSVFILRGRSHLLPLRLLSGGATGKNPKEHKPRANNRSPTSPLHFTPLRSTQPSIWLFLPARSLSISRILLSRSFLLSIYSPCSPSGTNFCPCLFHPQEHTSLFNTRPRERLSASMEIRETTFLLLIDCVSYFFFCVVWCVLRFDLVWFNRKGWRTCKLFQLKSNFSYYITCKNYKPY